jgi:hypothetical protein
MNKTVADALAADLATLTRVTDAPTESLGFGTDLSCLTDFTPDAREVDPMSREGIVESIVRRLSTPRGRVIDAPDFGYDLRGALNRATTDDTLRALVGDIRNELTKDDRIVDVDVELDTSDDRLSLRVSLFVEAVDPRVGGFDLVFVMTGDNITLEGAGT